MEQLSLFDPQLLTSAFVHPRLRLGTSSWSFPGWHPLVYGQPYAQLARHGLREYASHPLFRTVALDSGFYAPLEEAQYRRYAAAVPEDFRFLVKAPAALVRPDSADYLSVAAAWRLLVEPARRGLGEKLGCLHFFFPPEQPSLRGLAAFLRDLPGPVSVELRQPELLDERYLEALRSSGATHAWNVFPGMPLVQPEVGSLRVLRWTLGSPRLRPWNLREAALRYLPFGRIVDEDRATRVRLAGTIHTWLRQGHEVLVLANNKAEGCAPLSLQLLSAELAQSDCSGRA